MEDKNWDLTAFYNNLDDPQITKDVEELKKTIKELNEWAKNIKKSDAIEKYLDFKERLHYLLSKLVVYSYLVRSVDTSNGKANKLYNQVNDISSDTVLAMVRFERWLRDNEVEVSDEFKFHINELKKYSKYLLTEQEEELAAKLTQTGGDAWETLHEEIWSQLMVSYRDEELPLAKVRDLAHDKDPQVRKDAYEAEMVAYPKIHVSSAACLNNIKAEGTLLVKRRGYKNILDATIQDERMTEDILNALLDAIKESLPKLRKFFEQKAKILGKEKIDFYDIHAPVGEINKKFTVEEAEAIVLKHFTNFSPELGKFAKRAFDNNWIDYYPKEGKIGGGFCYPSYALKESRILMNFSGTFDNIMTLAHELGHAFDNEYLQKEHPVNTSDPRCLAETASTFAEKIVFQGVLEELNEEEKVVALQDYISSGMQTIVDIYSRFNFEDKFIKNREEGPLTIDEINDLMIESQKQAYGDLGSYHKYMWICKPHYYFVGRHYYNFPYAFGFLFSLGLMRLKDEENFMDKYKQVMIATGSKDTRDVGLIVDIDFADKEFWKSAIDEFYKSIEEFISLTL